MKRLAFFVSLLLLSTGAIADVNLIHQCEKLQSRNQELINLQGNVYNECMYNLFKSLDYIKLACDSVAIDRFYQAKQYFIQTKRALNDANVSNCKHKNLIIPLRNDVIAYSNLL